VHVIHTAAVASNQDVLWFQAVRCIRGGSRILSEGFPELGIRFVPMPLQQLVYLDLGLVSIATVYLLKIRPL
jgi:hypothetical protein